VTVRGFDVYRAIRNETRSFSQVAPILSEVYALDDQSAGLAGDMGQLFAGRVGSSYFDVIGVRPMLGRALRDGDAEAGAVVIGYDLWRRQFSGQRSLAGMTLSFGGRPHPVVGVMPHGLPGSAWLALPADAERSGAGFTGWAAVIARLRPGATKEHADSELAAVARHLTALYHSEDAPFGFTMASQRADPMRLSDLHWAMLGASFGVLLIACANLANLMLARGLAKRREIALRLAIGAGRAAVVWQMFAECAVLTVGGAGLGVALSLWGSQVVSTRVPRDMWWLGVVLPQLSWRVYALALLAAAAAAVLFGLLPAIRVANAVSLDEPLKDGAGTTGRFRQRYSALAIAETALALVLLMGAGLLLRAVQRLTSYEFNVAARQLLRSGTRVPKERAETPASRQRYEVDLLAAIRSVPGILDVASQSGKRAPGGALTAEMTGDSTRIVNLDYSVVSPNYFRTKGLPILVGRDFVDGDLVGDGAVIVNVAAAKRLYPGQRAVGRMLKLGGPASGAPWLPIVGVSRIEKEGRPSDVRDRPEETWADVFVVRAADAPADLTLTIRTAHEDPKIAAAVSRKIRTMGLGSYGWVVPYLYWYEGELRSRAFLAKLFVTMGAFALVLAAIGIYGVLAYAVSRRIREFAVRIALGAQRSDLLKSVLHDGLVMTLAGTGLGAFVALWSSYLLENLLEDIHPTDALTLVIAESVLIGVTVGACLAPAFRAMRADPIEILRAT
jgi:predicted permease